MQKLIISLTTIKQINFYLISCKLIKKNILIKYLKFKLNAIKLISIILKLIFFLNYKINFLRKF